ncbi:MAG: hypothetical protein JSW07_07045 [bacterium]|nr:MAG: hypothetical protein JSW07_07045 [bacterium]
MKKYLILVGVLLILCAVVLMGTVFKYTKLYSPIIKGNASGYRGAMAFVLSDADAASSMWVLGDTTAAGMYVPPQSLEITDLKVLWDPDSGDSIRVIVYAPNGDLANETIVDSDTLLGTAVAMDDSNTVSSTYKTVTSTEGLAIRYIAIAGSPNDVNIILEYKYRISDAYE